ncbi:MAG: aldehyde ferredoxin oxidoreductase family protein [Promethearchaeota archaeon]
MKDAQILWVSLSQQSAKEVPFSADNYAKFLGGRGLGVKLLYDRVNPEIDPLSPDNLLIFAVGPLTATSVPTAGRFAVVTKSPLTGTIFDSNCGGYFGPQLRRAGFTAVVIEGRATSPVYLWINDDEIEFRSAEPVWGKEVSNTTDQLLDETDRKAQVACIGPAGENQVKLASIMNDKHRAAGRGGVGAVMGAKNLKAVVIQGTKKVTVSDEKQLDQVVSRVRRLLKKDSITNKSLPVYGTAVLVNLINEYGLLPTYNFQEGTFNDAEGVSGEKLLERIFVKRYHCFGCPIGCGRITRAYGEEGGGPEYETIWALGPQCGVNDLEWIAAANNRCNELGLDTISLGSTIGCAMELVQKGNLDAQLSFGDTDGLIKLIDEIALAKGLGAELGEGSKILATRYNAPELAMQVKGLELPAYDPRGVQGHALASATSNRGGCHLRGYMIGPEILGSPVLVDRDRIEGKAGLVNLFQNLSAAMDSMILCRFTTFAFSVQDYADLVTAATDLSVNGKELLQIGERIWNLERLFNIREGFSAKDDCLPPRFSKPLPEGGSRNRIVHLEKMLPEYYRIRGWSSQGHPSKAKLKQLNIQ